MSVKQTGTWRNTLTVIINIINAFANLSRRIYSTGWLSTWFIYLFCQHRPGPRRNSWVVFNGLITIKYISAISRQRTQVILIIHESFYGWLKVWGFRKRKTIISYAGEFKVFSWTRKNRWMLNDSVVPGRNFQMCLWNERDYYNDVCSM